MAFSTYVLICMLVAGAYANIGSDCSGNDDCTTANSHCAHPFVGCEMGTCICDAGYYISGTSCREIREIGESCGQDSDCVWGTVGSSCSAEDVCVCDETTNGATMRVADYGGMSYCYEFSQGQDCAVPEECLTYVINAGRGICDNTCQCAEEFIPSGQGCITVANGDSCAPDEGSQVDKQCDPVLECTQDTHVCECPENHFFSTEFNTCVHDEVNMVGQGADCDNTPLVPDSDHCNSIDLACAFCPESTNTNTICLEISGASGSTFSFATLLSLLVLTLGKLFA